MKNFRMRMRFVLFLLSSLFFTVEIATADIVVYSQPIVDGSAVYTGELADNFILSTDAAVSSITFWNTSTAESGFTVNLYEDNGSGQPETIPFASFSMLTGTAVPSGFHTGPGDPVFKHELLLPEAHILKGGRTYYLSILQAEGYSLWSGAGLGSFWARGGIYPSWTNSAPGNSSNLAFEITANTATALISIDDPLFGPGSITRDTETHLEWLDLTASMSYSYQEMLEQMNAGGVFEEYRLAKSDEVNELWLHAGLPGLGGHVESEELYDPIRNFLSLFGVIQRMEIYGSIYEASEGYYVPDSSAYESQSHYLYSVYPEKIGVMGVYYNGSSGNPVHTAGGYIVKKSPSPVLTWTEQNPIPTGNGLRAVWGSSASDVYAVGGYAMLHYDGSRWAPVESGATSFLWGIWGVSASDVYAVGYNGMILHYDGSSWTGMTSGTTQNLLGVWGSSASDVYAVGVYGTILHYDGNVWSTLNTGCQEHLYGVWGSSASDVYAVGYNGTILHYDGSKWTHMNSGTTNSLNAVWGNAASNIFAVGDSGTLLHYDGNSWNSVITGETGYFSGIWGSGPSDVFVLGSNGKILRYDGSRWSNMDSGTAQWLWGGWGTSGSDIYIVGDNGLISHYDGAVWSSMNSGPQENLYGVWGSSGSDVFAVGDKGTILHHDGHSWAGMISGTTQDLQGVWGSSSTDVFAVGYYGTILHYDGTAWAGMNSGTTRWLRGLWGSSGSDVFAVGEGGTILHFDGSNWSPMVSGTTNFLWGVWGSSASDVFAVGDNGTILHYDGTHWVTMNSGTTQGLMGVWGGSGTSVYAVGMFGTILHYDGDSWTSMYSTSSRNLYSAWGSGPSDVFVVGGVGTILHYDGSNWTSMFSGTAQYFRGGIWGESGMDVFAVGDGGTILHYGVRPTDSDGDGLPDELENSYCTDAQDADTDDDGLADGVEDANQNGVVDPGETNPCSIDTDGDDIQDGTERGLSSADIDPSYTNETIFQPDEDPSTTTDPLNNDSDGDGVQDGLEDLNRNGKLDPGESDPNYTSQFPEWQRQNPYPSSNNMYSVWGISETDVFAAGFGEILHYDGTEWRSMDLEKEEIFADIWGDSGTNVFAVGNNGTILHYDGNKWNTMNSGSTENLRSVWGCFGGDVFAVGNNGTILHYDGNSWKSMNSGTVQYLWGVWGSSRTDIFAVGANGTILHFDGSNWSNMSSGTAQYLVSVWGTSGTNVYAVGSNGTILHYNGSNWVSTAMSVSSYLYDVWGSSASDVFAVGANGLVWHYDGISWSGKYIDFDLDLWGIWGSSGSNVFGVGLYGRLLKYDGSNWLDMSSGPKQHIYGIWGNSEMEVFAAGAYGKILQYTEAGWNSYGSPSPLFLYDIWGCANSEIFAVGDSGTILYNNGNDWIDMSIWGLSESLYGVWGSSGEDVYSVGLNGIILHYNGNGWTNINSGTTKNLRGIWGNSSTDIFAVGDGGTILHYDGNSWISMLSGTSQELRGVWGSSASNVFAVGDGGTILHYDGGSWTVLSSGTAQGLHGIWGNSGANIFAVGNVGTILHYDGSSWKQMDSNTTQNLFAVWGSSGTNVFAVGAGGTILHYGITPTDTDTDHDGLPDTWETDNGLDPNNPDDAALDSDNDGLSNIEEYQNDTKPLDADTDDDGMPDGWEVDHALNPSLADDQADADGDGLNNGDEYRYQTDPQNADTDGDGINDRDEVDAGTNPLGWASSLTCASTSLTLSLGERHTVLLQLANKNRIADTFDISISGIDGTWYTLQENRLTLLAGEVREIPLLLHIPPDCAIETILYTIHASAVSPETGPVENGGVELGLQLQMAPQISNLIPEGGERISTNTMTFTWNTNVEASTELYYRKAGESDYQVAEGEPGTIHRVRLDNLAWDRSYEWYAASTGTCAGVQSDVRSFTVQDGVVFTQRQYSFEILRDYDQRVTLDVVNRDVVPHDVVVSVTNTQEELIAGFVESGSQDETLRLEPGESKTVTLALHAQDTTENQYSLTFRLTADPESGNPITDFVPADISVRDPVFNLVFTQTNTNPVLRTNTYRITNNGDAITDLRVFAEASAAPMIVFQPRIEHYRLDAGETVYFKAVFQPAGGITQYTGLLTAEGGGESVSLSTHFGCPSGTNLYDVVLSDAHLCIQARSWYCTNRPVVSVNFDVPQGVAPENILGARLYINFSLTWPRDTYRPHNVTVKLNDQAVASFNNTIPEGPYGIELPRGLVHTGTGSAGRNVITLVTEHLNHGHFVVVSDFQVILNVSDLEVGAVCAASQSAADEAAREFPFLCSGEPAWELCPQVTDIVPLDENGDPKWNFSPGEQVRFRVSVANPDLDDSTGTLTFELDDDFSAGEVRFQATAALTLPAGASVPREFVWTVPRPAPFKLLAGRATITGDGDCSKVRTESKLIAINQPVVGVVKDNETGAGMDGIQVCGFGFGPNGLADIYTDCATTDADGRFTLYLPEGRNAIMAGAKGFSSDIEVVDTAGVSPTLTLSHDSSHYGPDADSGYANDPVNTALGNFTQEHVDLSFPGRGLNFSFERFYNSQDAYNGVLGYGWTHNYNVGITKTGDIAVVKYGDGRDEFYVRQADGSYAPQPGVYNMLTEGADGSFTLEDKRQTVYRFNEDGRLIDITDRNGNVMAMTYSGGHLTTMTDPVGRQVLFSYDAAGRIIQISDPIGRTVRFAYDAMGNLASAFDALGNETVYTYDADHQMLTATDPMGNVFVTNTYDSENRVVTAQSDALGNVSTFSYDERTHTTVITDPLGNRTVHEHDNRSRLVKITDPLRNTQTMAWDDRNNRIRTKDPRGGETRFEYDARGNLIKVVDALGFETRLAYDADNNPTQTTDAMGNVTGFEYDESGNLIQKTDALSNQTVMSYNAFGQPTSVTDARGNATGFAYDGQGNLAMTTDALGNVVTRTFDGVGRMTGQTDPNGHTTTFVYDAGDHLVGTTDPAPLSYTETSQYDANGNRIRVTDKRGYTTTFAYDAKNRLTTVTDPQGSTVVTEYDALDRKIAVTDKRGNTTRYEYDATGNLVGVLDALGQATRSVYDAGGNLISRTDPSGRTVHFTYDALGRKVSSKDALENQTLYEYDPLGRLTSRTDGNGNITRYQYDAAGRLVKVTEPGGAVTQYAYDALGNKVGFTNANGVTFSYVFDALNRMVSDADGYQYQYDGAGNLIRRTDAKGQELLFTHDVLGRVVEKQIPGSGTVTYAYDPAGNLTAMADPLGATSRIYSALNQLVSSTDPYGKTVQMDYDANGNRIGLTYPDGGQVAYAYDELNRLAAVTDWGGQATTYGYDSAGNLVETRYPNGAWSTQTYDDASRLKTLVSQSSSNGVICSYDHTLDAVGNRVGVEQHEPLIPYVKTRDRSYLYDAENRLVSMTDGSFTYDANGSVTVKTDGGKTYTYAWDEENRLISVSSGAGLSTFSYDGLDHRLVATRDGVTTRYVLDTAASLPNVIAETDATGAITTKYIYGLGLIAKVDAGGTHYYHFDPRGSTIAVTDGAGNMTDKYAYDPFGTLANRGGEGKNPFTFVGQFGLMDEGDGLYFVRARYYDSRIGRFLSKDPYPGEETDPESLHRYAYVGNNPIGFVDVSGLCGEDISKLSSLMTELFSRTIVDLAKHYGKQFATQMELNSIVHGNLRILGGTLDTEVIGYSLKKGFSFLTLATLSSKFGRDLGENWDDPNMDWTEKLGRALMGVTLNSSLSAINIASGGSAIPVTAAIGMAYEKKVDKVWEFVTSEYFITDTYGDWIYNTIGQTKWGNKFLLW